MNNTHSFFSRFCHSPIPRLAAVTLVALALSSLASCAETRILNAARDGDLGKVQALLKDHPDLVFSKDNTGGTLLHVAAAKGYKDVAELLLANKADANAKNNGGATPLHYAALEDHKDVVKLLRQHGGNE